MKSVNTFVDQQTGTKPYHKLVVSWGASGPTTQVTYVTCRGIENTKPALTAVGEVSVSVGQDNAASYGSAQISLDDSDGQLLNLYNLRLLDGSRARLYLCFRDGGSDTLLMKGKVQDLTWLEGDKSVTFNVQTDAKSQEIDFALRETTELPNPDKDNFDVTWPLCFGSPVHVKAVRVRKQRRGALLTAMNLWSDGYLVSDQKISTEVALKTQSYEITETDGSFTSAKVDNKLFIENGDLFPQGTEVKINIDGCIFEGTFNGNVFTVSETNVSKYEPIQLSARIPDANEEHLSPKVVFVPEGTPSLVGHHVQLDIVGTVTWNFVERQEGRRVYLRYATTTGRGQTVLATTTGSIEKVLAVQQNGFDVDIEKIVEDANYASEALPGNGEVKALSLANELDLLKKDISHFWQRPEGTIVRLWDANDPDVYVINAVPSTQLRGVYCERTYTDVETGFSREVFSPVPTSLFEVNLNDNIDGVPCTTLIFPTGLDGIKDQQWKEEIYCTVVSTIGSSFMDILDWIEPYTGSVINKSHASTYGSWDKYPMNFALTSPQDAIQLVVDLAWQARCGVVTGDENLKIIYLSRFVGSNVMTINPTNRMERSLILSNSSRVDLRTSVTGTWNETGAPEAKLRQTTFKRNVSFFGKNLLERDLFAYNNEEPVLKTVRFWAERYANVWKEATCIVELPALRLEVWDRVTIESSKMTPTSMTAYVIGWTYSSSDLLITLKLWFPYTVGDLTAYPFAFFSDDADPTPTNRATNYGCIDYVINRPAKAKTIEDIQKKIKEIEKQVKQKVQISSVPTAPDVAYKGQLLAPSNKEEYTVTPATPSTVVDITPAQFATAPAIGQIVEVVKDFNGNWVMDSPATAYGRLINNALVPSGLNAHLVSALAYTVQAVDLAGNPIVGKTFTAIDRSGCLTVPLNNTIQKFYMVTLTHGTTRVGPLWVFDSTDRVCCGRVISQPSALAGAYGVIPEYWDGTSWVSASLSFNAHNTVEGNTTSPTDFSILGINPSNPYLPPGATIVPVRNGTRVLLFTLNKDRVGFYYLNQVEGTCPP